MIFDLTFTHHLKKRGLSRESCDTVLSIVAQTQSLIHYAKIILKVVVKVGMTLARCHLHRRTRIRMNLQKLLIRVS